jgi:Zn-dependent protease
LAASAAVFSYFGLILLHEAGHAWMAQRIGYRPMAIYLGVFHGLCEHESPESQKHASLIAWGGVAAQLLVALPLIALAALTPAMAISGLRVVITVLGYYSLLIAAFNLAPASFLDGGQAWRLLPILAGERRRRHKVRDAASRGIRRVK